MWSLLEPAAAGAAAQLCSPYESQRGNVNRAKGSISEFTCPASTVNEKKGFMIASSTAMSNGSIVTKALSQAIVRNNVRVNAFRSCGPYVLLGSKAKEDTSPDKVDVGVGVYLNEYSEYQGLE
ncbi:hypothetical protein HD806DRAFT_327518 [Xylariaceae sp. AK1471]|nr:hypothetical protein HD806DRAFT_327518 [Xylariaceae sp. AK1471]